MSLPSKTAIRTAILQKRYSLSQRELTQKAYQLASLVIQRPEFIFSRYIAGYWPNNGEINPLPLMHYASAVLKKRCYLPVLNSYSDGNLEFVEYQEGEDLIPNRFGIPEPKSGLQKIIPASNLDLVLAPLVAFDERGNRLGMGGGFYDKTFSFLKKANQLRNEGPYLLGLGYEFQRVKRLPFEAHDVPLNGVATEKRYKSTRLV